MQDSGTTSITVRLPHEMKKRLEQQANETKTTISAIVLTALDTNAPTILVRERHLLPDSPGGYFVFTSEKKLLHVGKTSSLQKEWARHYYFQDFIEADVDSKIAYFPVDSLTELDQIFSFVQAGIDPTIGSVDDDIKIKELEAKVEQRLAEYKKETDVLVEDYRRINESMRIKLESFHNFFMQLTANVVLDKLSLVIPPRGRQTWEPSAEDKMSGIIKSELVKKLGFYSPEEFQKACSYHKIIENAYLMELSGWIPEYGSKARWVAPKTSTNQPQKTTSLSNPLSTTQNSTNSAQSPNTQSNSQPTTPTTPNQPTNPLSTMPNPTQPTFPNQPTNPNQPINLPAAFFPHPPKPPTTPTQPTPTTTPTTNQSLNQNPTQN